MLFVIDVGNTQTLLGVYEGERLAAHWRLSSDRERTVDEYGLLARTLFSLEDVDSDGLEGIVVSCVVPPLVGTLERVGREYFDVEPLMVTAELVADLLPIRYRPPGDVGSDRIVNALAARDRYGAPAVVVDFGTATTFDVIDADSAYLGGVIAPGVGVSSDALFARAARLPRVDIARPATVVGRSTVESIQAGLFFGYVDMVDGLLERIREALGERPRTVATGGWAETIGPECRGIDAVDPWLTLEGLQIVYKEFG